LRFRDRDRLDDAFRLRADQIDREQAVLEVCALHFHTLGQHEAALKLAGSDAAMEILAALILLPPAANHQLVLLQRHIKLLARKARHRERDAQPLRTGFVAGDALDIVRRVAVGGSRDAVENTFDLVETKQKGTRKRRNPGHVLKALVTATLCEARMAPPSAGRPEPRPTCEYMASASGRCKAAKIRFWIGHCGRSGRFSRYFNGPGRARSASAASCA